MTNIIASVEMMFSQISHSVSIEFGYFLLAMVDKSCLSNGVEVWFVNSSYKICFSCFAGYFSYIPSLQMLRMIREVLF